MTSLVPMDVACCLSWGEGIETPYPTGSSWRPCSQETFKNMLKVMLTPGPECNNAFSTSAFICQVYSVSCKEVLLINYSDSDTDLEPRHPYMFASTEPPLKLKIIWSKTNFFFPIITPTPTTIQLVAACLLYWIEKLFIVLDWCTGPLAQCVFSYTIYAYDMSMEVWYIRPMITSVLCNGSQPNHTKSGVTLYVLLTNQNVSQCCPGRIYTPIRGSNV